MTAEFFKHLHLIEEEKRPLHSSPGKKIENDFYCDLDLFSRKFSPRRASGWRTREQNGCEGEKYVFIPHKSGISSMKTYPYTCPKSKGRESDREFRSHAVSYPENNQQSTNKNMCNGENSDPRDHCLRYCHFEAKTSADGGNPIMIFTAMRAI